MEDLVDADRKEDGDRNLSRFAPDTLATQRAASARKLALFADVSVQIDDLNCVSPAPLTVALFPAETRLELLRGERALGGFWLHTGVHRPARGAGVL